VIPVGLITESPNKRWIQKWDYQQNKPILKNKNTVYNSGDIIF
jgi:hypothetical protein